MEQRSPSFNNEPFFELLGPSNVNSSPPQNNNLRRSGNQDYDFGGDDVLPGFDYQTVRRSASTDSTGKFNSASSGQDSSLNTSRHRQSSSSVPSMVYVKGETSELRPSTLIKEIDMDAYHAAVVTAVEGIMKKYADNLLRVLEGMCGRLSQLELVTQGLEHSIREVRGSMANNHGEADGKLRMLSNHLSERTVQLLRDKQEIAEAHAELVKLQLSKGERSGKGANVEPVANEPQADATSLTQENTPQRFTTLPLLPAPQQHAPLPQAESPILHQQPAKTEQPAVEANIQHQTSLPLSSYTTAQQLQSYYAQNAPLQQSQPVQLQDAQPSLLAHIQQSLPQQVQVQQPVPHVPIQQPLSQQTQFQQSMLQQPQMPQHAQVQQPPLQQSQIQQPLPQQAQCQQPLLQHTQLQQSLPQHQPMPQHMQPLPHQEQVQQSMPQQGQIQQALHSQQPLPMQLQSAQQHMPSHSQALQQPLHASQMQMQQIPGSHVFQSPQQPVARGPFQQFSHQPESSLCNLLPQGQVLSLPGNYSAPHASGSYTTPPQRLVPQSGPLTSQLHSGSHAYDSAIQKSSSSQPITNLTYDSSGMVLPSGYGGSMYRVPQPGPAFQTGHPHLPSAQPISGVFSPPRFPQATAVPGSGGNIPNRAPVDEIIERVAAMGFSRDQVRSVVRKLTENGQSVDLNVVLDKLMNGVMEDQSQRSWYGR